MDINNLYLSAFKHLKKDAVMSFLIDEFEHDIDLLDRYDSNYSKAISFLIIEQQVSFKAAIAIKKRFDILIKNLSNKEVYELNIQKIKNVGISQRKADYIKNTYHFFLTTDVDFTKMDDQSVISRLCKIKGVGEWTAQMFLMFVLFRSDIFAPKDLALINSIKRNYLISDINKINKLQLKWAPYRSIASLLLWKSIETNTFYAKS
ncbi:MAG: hypothetical protein CL824_01745 [Crocinitomicaceae bacterium]|nr:hypothetical protein [Crocinitomicaceae bacterium]